MSDWTFLEILAAGLVGGPIAVYLAVRFGAAAFFKSKATYEQQRK